METKKLPIIPKPVEGTRSILIANAIKGAGDVNYVCGKCEKILAEGMNEGQIKNIVLKCSCGAFNDVA